MAHFPKNKAFTLVELMVTVSIFVFMTALLLAKYGSFNQSVLLTNLAYDVALTIRTAQTYGLSVKSSAASFQYAYGVDFCAAESCTITGQTLDNRQITLFNDTSNSGNNNGVYDNSAESVLTYSIKRGAKISGFCATDPCSAVDNSITRADITFLRPNPDATICLTAVGSPDCGSQYLKIFVQSSDGNSRNVVVRHTGQVSVEN